MKRTCQNCNSPLFDTDTICWHCGQQQSSPSPQELVPSQEFEESKVKEEPEPEPELEPVGTSLILFYGGLLIAIILVLFLISRSLGRSPVIVLPTEDEEGEWVSLTVPDQSSSIKLPASWDWTFNGGGQAGTNFKEIFENDARIEASLRPLGDLIPDINHLLIAEQGQSLLIISRSERLNQLSPQQAVESLQNEGFTGLIIDEARHIQGPSGEGESRAKINVTNLDTSMQCIQHMVPGPTETYLVSLCSPEEAIGGLQRTSFDILNSFTVRDQ